MTERSTHEDVIELLPWFVNGTLGEQEAALVEAHVHECVRCFSLLQQERQLHGLLSAESSTPIASAVHGFERLRPKLEPDARRAREEAGRRWRSPEGFALAAGLAALAVAVIIWERFDNAPPVDAGEFETLSAPTAATSRTVDIIFAPALMETEMRILLQSVGAVIVNGPTDIGRYTIRIDQSPDGLEPDAVVERLRADPRVRFVGPSFIGEAR